MTANERKVIEKVRDDLESALGEARIETVKQNICFALGQLDALLEVNIEE